MSTKKLTARRLVATVITATIMSVTVGGLISTEAHAAKCIPGSGNPLNPCP